MADGWAVHYGNGFKAFTFDRGRAPNLAVSLHGTLHPMEYMMTRADLQDALTNQNVQAMLRVVRAGEGTSDEDGYRRMFTGPLFDSFEAHPRQKHQSGSLISTAAGAYQFLARTWDDLLEQYDFPDFSPQCQDEGAVALIARRHALDDVKAGDLVTAIRKCNKEWASLPESPYGQPTRTMAQATGVFTEHGGVVA